MSKRLNKIELDENTISRLRHCRDGITRARCWHDGYKAAGGYFLWGDCLIDAQVILDRIISAVEKGRRG